MHLYLAPPAVRYHPRQSVVAQFSKTLDAEAHTYAIASPSHLQLPALRAHSKPQICILQHPHPTFAFTSPCNKHPGSIHPLPSPHTAIEGNPKPLSPCAQFSHLSTFPPPRPITLLRRRSQVTPCERHVPAVRPDISRVALSGQVFPGQPGSSLTAANRASRAGPIVLPACSPALLPVYLMPATTPTAPGVTNTLRPPPSCPRGPI